VKRVQDEAQTLYRFNHTMLFTDEHAEEFRKLFPNIGEGSRVSIPLKGVRFYNVKIGRNVCMVDMNDFTYAVVKNTPERIAELQDTHTSWENQRNMSKKYWIQINFGGDFPDSEILDLVKQSYGIVKAKYNNKK